MMKLYQKINKGIDKVSTVMENPGKSWKKWLPWKSNGILERQKKSIVCNIMGGEEAVRGVWKPL